MSAAEAHPPTTGIPPCPECGYDYGRTTSDAALHVITEGVAEAARLLVSASPRVTRRPGPVVWSPLEYGAHVRDVLMVQRDRILLALVVDNPHFTPMYRDERSRLARYDQEAPEDVSAMLVSASGLLDWLARGLETDQLARPCIYNLPEPISVDVGWVLVHTGHEVHHHLDDIGRGLGESGP